MKNVFVLVCVISTSLSLFAFAQNKYVGVKSCSICHKGKKNGSQLEVWQKSNHAQAFKTLSTAKAVEIAKANGLKKAANKSSECLVCHAITADPKLTQDGVQCEMCHGAGSAYMTMSIMKDKEKAVAMGLIQFKDKEAIEEDCRKCHNENSARHKFVSIYLAANFDEMWAKIKHPIPTK